MGPGHLPGNILVPALCGVRRWRFAAGRSDEGLTGAQQLMWTADRPWVQPGGGRPGPSIPGPPLGAFSRGGLVTGVVYFLSKSL